MINQTRLTEKQEAFVQALVHGKSQRQAYLEAYNTSTMNMDRVDQSASTLFAKPKIRQRYEELRADVKERIAEKTAITVEELLAHCAGVIAGTKKDTRLIVSMDGKTKEVEHEANQQTKAKFVDMAAKMLGAYSQTVNVNADIMTTDSPRELLLKKLAEMRKRSE